VNISNSFMLLLLIFVSCTSSAKKESDQFDTPSAVEAPTSTADQRAVPKRNLSDLNFSLDFDDYLDEIRNRRFVIEGLAIYPKFFLINEGRWTTQRLNAELFQSAVRQNLWVLMPPKKVFCDQIRKIYPDISDTEIADIYAPILQGFQEYRTEKFNPTDIEDVILPSIEAHKKGIKPTQSYITDLVLYTDDDAFKYIRDYYNYYFPEIDNSIVNIEQIDRNSFSAKIEETGKSTTKKIKNLKLTIMGYYEYDVNGMIYEFKE
jgi:hypothetical protein